MSDLSSSDEPSRDAKPAAPVTGEADPSASASSGATVGSSGDPLGLAALSSSSWANTADVEIQHDLIAGRVFGGAPLTIDRFEIEKLLGIGSSAAVYAARDSKLDRRVAIKILARARDGQVGPATERSIREARALAHVSHRNVVSIYEVGQWNDRPFIVMELIEGTTLARWLAAQRRSVAEVLAVFRDAGCGLAAAHARGHVHRDFKPANVLVADDGRVVVSDFGLVGDAAQDAELAGQAGPAPASDSAGRAPHRPFVGTPAYAAPEQRAGAAAHPSADVYSFAVALVEAMLGYHPEPESNARWMAALRKRVPRRLYRALCVALMLQPQQRAQSLGPLLQALAVRGDVRSRRVAGTLAVGGAVLLVAVALAWTRWGRAPTEPKEPADLPAPPLSLRPVELSQEVKALLETPPERRDDRWRERARTMLMLPIPTRVPCPWLARPLKVLLVGDHAIALDPHGRVTSCAISTGTADTIADGVTCLQEVDDTMFGVAFRDLRIAVYRHRASGWSPVPLEGPTMAPGIVGPGDCTFQVTAQGHASPRISLQAPRAWSNHDVDVFAGGGRTIRVKGDYSLWVQAGDAPPALLVPSPVGWFKFDEALHYAVAQTSEHVRIYDVVSGTLVAEAPLPEAAYGVFRGFSRDGSAAVVLGSDGRLLWWRRGQRQWRSQPIAMTAPGGMQLSRRGERVVMWDPLNGGLDVRDLTSGRRYSLTDARIRKAEFLDDDQVVAIVEPGGVWRWSLAHQRSWVLADHGGPAKQGMWGFTTCDRGSSVVTGTNREDQEILMSSPSGGPQVVLPKPPGARIYGLACRGDRILAGTRDGHVLEWQWPTGRALAVHDLGVRAWIWTVAMAQPADGPGVVLLGTGQIRDPEPRNRVGGRVIALRNGDLTTLASTGLGGNTGIDDLAVSSDGRRAVAVSSSSQLVLIDVAGVAASPPQNGHTGEVGHVRFLEGDRSVVTAGDDGYLRIWDIVDGALALRSEVPLGHGRILTLDIRGTVAMVGTSDGHLGAWDLTTGSLVRAYRGHSSWVVDGVFDASGQWIASGDYEGRVCLHRIDLDDCYAALVGHQRTPVSHVRFLDDGQIITVSEDGTIRQWKPPYEASSAELACELEGYLFERGVSGAAMHGCAEDEPRLGHAVRRDDPIGAQRRPSGGGL